MNERQATNALLALAQPSRLQIIRTIASAGSDGLYVGDVAAAIGGKRSVVDFHLKALERAGLIESRRVSRSPVYSAADEGVAGLIAFLQAACRSASSAAARSG